MDILQINRADFIESARSLLGLDWKSVTHIWRDANGRWQGSVSCVGLVLVALRECGILPTGFDPNLSQMDEAQKVRYLWRLLGRNAREVPVEQTREGDLMLCAWRDVKANATEVHHVNICTSLKPRMTMLEALSRKQGGTGTVCEVPVSPLDLRRTQRVFRLNVLEVV